MLARGDDLMRGRAMLDEISAPPSLSSPRIYPQPPAPPTTTTSSARSSWQIMIYLSAISWGVLIVMCLWPPVWTMVPR